MAHCPLMSVTHEGVAVTVPLTAKRMVTPPTGFAKASATTAATLWLVPTGFVACAGVTPTLAGSAACQVFVAVAPGSTEPWAPSPSVSAKAAMVSAPGAAGPAYVNPHTPSAPVVHEPAAVTEPLTSKRTITPGTRSPSAVATVAVRVCVAPTVDWPLDGSSATAKGTSGRTKT